MKFKKSIAAFALAAITSLTTISANADTLYLSSKNNFDNYLKIAEKATGRNLVIASSKSYADSLSAINEVYKHNDHLMLVDDNSNIEKVVRTITPDEIKIVGGPKTVSKDIERRLAKMKKTSRTYGKDRYATNKATINSNKVIVASGENFADAISSTNLIKEYKVPVMLVKQNQKTIDKYAMFTVGGPKSVYYSFGKRIYGQNRYKTNEMTIKKMKAANEIVVNASDFQLPLLATNVVFSGDYAIKLTAMKQDNEMLIKSNTDKNKDTNVSQDTSKDTSKETQKDKPKDESKDKESNKEKENEKGKETQKDTSKDNKPVHDINDKNKDKEKDTSKETSKEKPKDDSKDKGKEEPAKDKPKEDNTPLIEGFSTVTLNNKKYVAINTPKDTFNYIQRVYKTGKINDYPVAIEQSNMMLNNSKIDCTMADWLAVVFEIPNHKDINKDGKVYVTGDIKIFARNRSYFDAPNKGEISISRLLRNRDAISEIIDKSGARSETSKKAQADAVGKYLKTHFAYYDEYIKPGFEATPHDEYIARYPFTITENGKGVCEGFIRAFQEVLRQLEIPSYAKVVDKGKHIISVAYLDGQWIPYDIVGYLEGPHPDYKVKEQDLRKNYGNDLNTEYDKAAQEEVQKQIAIFN